MNRPRLLATLLVLPLLHGCGYVRITSVPPFVPDPSLQDGGTCSEVPARFVLGKTVDERLAEDARVRSGARVVRVLRPGVVHDDEQRDSRLDLETDQQGQIVAVRCG
ncbi:I78 family peptidase inhibitor [Xylophilus sp. GOD-11R]|uniref:I78 family peptidase inhibitor n=1 Tax=Xylophilus sp. GOD-11R TaxID=3089814 RepID=UPI00298C2803|nr:I78 family peptidase inhibitor [Xylophilus sp. GOD-11R]WPB57532.1 I78 family peptidase inhibitor [Xylophilus sp. GOD-11R]